VCTGLLLWFFYRVCLQGAEDRCLGGRGFVSKEKEKNVGKNGKSEKSKKRRREISGKGKKQKEARYDYE